MRRWSIIIDTAASSDDHRTLHHTDDLAEHFRVCLRSRDTNRVSNIFPVIQPRSYGAQLTFACNDPTKASTIAVDLFTQAAEKAGLPAWPIIGLQVLAETGSQERLDPAAGASQLVGTAEATAMLEVSRRRLAQLSQRPD